MTRHAFQRWFLPLHRAAAWPDAARYQHDLRAAMLARLLPELPRAGVEVVLDVGCGDGWVSRELARHYPRVVGMDINPARIALEPTPGVLLIAASAAQPPLADGSVDLIVSVTVLEHLVDRVGVLRNLARLLRPGGKMLHILPAPAWKVLQWAGFVPDRVRQELRGVARALAGVRTARPPKYHAGRETNNPQRPTRRSWRRKLLPRVHGEYESNWQEFRGWSVVAWRRQFEAAGLRVVQSVPLGLHSPYAFGIGRWCGAGAGLGAASARGWIVEPIA